MKYTLNVDNILLKYCEWHTVCNDVPEVEFLWKFMSDIFSFMILELLKFVNHNGAMTIKCLQGN